jgi:hypothetical protein
MRSCLHPMLLEAVAPVHDHVELAPCAVSLNRVPLKVHCSNGALFFCEMLTFVLKRVRSLPDRDGEHRILRLPNTDAATQRTTDTHTRCLRARIIPFC